MFDTIIFYLTVFLILRLLLIEAPTIIQFLHSAWLDLQGIPINLKEKYGDWAVITGASDGIGKAYSAQLASKGINIVLIGRNKGKLEDVATDLVTRFSIQTKLIIADFSHGREIYPKIKEELQDIDVSILVNNVGVQYNYPMPIIDLPEQEIWDNLNINIASAVVMTRIVLPKLTAKNKGAIINISSIAGEQPQPYMNLYACSKTYLTYFSEALREELKNTNLTVQTITPGYVSSKINHFQARLQKVGFFIPDVDTYAEYAVSTIGRLDTTTGCPAHRLTWFLLKIVPTWVRTKYVGATYKKYGEIYLKKKLSGSVKK